MTPQEEATCLHEIMVLNDRIIALEGDCAHLMALCAQAADALEEEFGDSFDPAYGVKGPIHELITELRKAAQ